MIWYARAFYQLRRSLNPRNTIQDTGIIAWRTKDLHGVEAAYSNHVSAMARAVQRGPGITTWSRSHNTSRETCAIDVPQQAAALQFEESNYCRRPPLCHKTYKALYNTMQQYNYENAQLVSMQKQMQLIVLRYNNTIVQCSTPFNGARSKQIHAETKTQRLKMSC